MYMESALHKHRQIDTYRNCTTMQWQNDAQFVLEGRSSERHDFYPVNEFVFRKVRQSSF